MINLPNYRIAEQIYESASSVIYRATRISDNQAVILKALQEDYPSAEKIAHYKQEYKILCHLQEIAGVVKAYEQQVQQNNIITIFEVSEGQTLKKLMLTPALNKKGVDGIISFLDLAIKICQILAEVHAANVIHKDLNPHNILYNPETKKLSIIDFGISSLLPRENPSLKNQNQLEGTLAYLSPEQTGRMNRTLDYRTDFYALGVTFYELLTHRLPFDTEDAIELIHSHLAKYPTPPNQLNANIPQAVSDIVMKMMEKMAENRYQSAWGIKTDLEYCKQELERHSEIDPSFKIAQQDISYRLQLPQKLYGRDQEIQSLLTAFDNASLGESQIMLVTGYAGVGKSALVQELYKPITAKRGYFVSGKFDQFQRNTPYSAIVAAFRNLIQQLLTESEDSLARWRMKLGGALDFQAQVIIDVIPELKLIMGEQPAVESLNVNETQARFHQLFKQFVYVFCQPEHPLAVFLDDLHWADSASLDWVSMIMHDSEYLFLIGAYRENEVSPAHPLMLCLNDIEQQGSVVKNINLDTLSLQDVNYFVSDSLNAALEKTYSLAALVMQKTQGNPFFMNEFLKSLYSENLLDFDWQYFEWRWDTDKIAECEITENVVAILTKKLKQLPSELQEILQRAACIGNQFQLQTLALVCEDEFEHLLLQINLAIQEGILIQTLHSDDVSLSEYAFVHDRVQQAVYLLIEPDFKQITHWQVGQLLLENISPEQREQYVFTIVDQLNIGIDPKDYYPMLPLFDMDIFASQVYLAELNYKAGKKAKDATAYVSAFDYFYIAIQLLTQERWHSHYELALNIYEQAIDAAYLSNHLDEVDELSQVVFEQAHHLLDKIKTYEIKILADTARDDSLAAINLGLDVLAELGEKFPKKPKSWHLTKDYLTTRWAVRDKTIESLVNRPPMTDKNKLAAMRIMARITVASYSANPELMPLLAMRMMLLSVRYGVTQEAPIAYVTYGQFLCGSIQDIEDGYRFGQLALDLLNKYPHFKAQTLFSFHTFIAHSKKHLKQTLKPLSQAYQNGLETADLEFASRSIFIHCSHSLALGLELNNLEQEMRSYEDVVRQLGQHTVLHRIKIFRQMVLNLMGQSDKLYTLVGKAYNEEESLSNLINANDRSAVCWIYLHKMVLCYLFRDLAGAVQNAAEAKAYLGGISAMLYEPIFYFYDSLIKVAIAERASKSKKAHLLLQVWQNQQKLNKWKKHAPMNHLHKYYLVEAERHRLKGHAAKAMTYYNEAIHLAQDNNYPHEVALANELAGLFFLDQSQQKIAQVYLREAHYMYQKWGVTAKVQDLEAQYLPLIHQPTAPQHNKSDTVSTTTTVHATLHSGEGSTINLDLDSVLKASQAIAGEIVLDSLLENLMKIVVENAGAERGVLLLNQDGQLVVEAENEIHKNAVKVLQSQPLNQAKLPKTLINFVARMKESIVLHNALEEGQFTRDAYVMQHKSQSILCTPLLHQGKLVGILYLENQLMAHTFTPQRLELLNLLSSQITISIENAHLYTNMSLLNQAYERFVPREFLSLLDKQSVMDVGLGDQVEKEMSILFSDIRDFTTISEQMPPQENFDFINAFLSRMEPNILDYNGFIDKYIGDAIMALFPTNADDAVQAAIDMLMTLNEYNKTRGRPGRPVIRIGVGIHTGKLMLGTVGGRSRMDGTVISDAVNLASRIEGLTKIYGTSLLITEHTYQKLSDPSQYKIRMIDRVRVKGKSEAVTVYEIFDADEYHVLHLKQKTFSAFELGLKFYHEQELTLACNHFEEVLTQNRDDHVAKVYLERCQLGLMNDTDMSST
ncbi:AAA family ATPase [Candidatus Albibeggiatoa sp. nov. NOAA]|uniref:AAA family ATPase n=1 Tax=Candidatus Albibeggiatoa sp. nov. NOAA TaxID=3162724 RepID=UPI0032F59EED|nr:AAA family ATPase [Thiotrichaceae bacterium]